MATKLTKAELEKKVEKLTKKIDELKAYIDNEVIRNSGNFDYLYTAENMSAEYAQSVINKTKLLRVTTFYEDDMEITAHAREFHDGNRVFFIMYKSSSKDDKKQTKCTIAKFYKRHKAE